MQCFRDSSKKLPKQALQVISLIVSEFSTSELLEKSQLFLNEGKDCNFPYESIKLFSKWVIDLQQSCDFDNHETHSHTLQSETLKLEALLKIQEPDVRDPDEIEKVQQTNFNDVLILAGNFKCDYIIPAP